MNNFTPIMKISSFCLIFFLSVMSGWAQCEPPTAILISDVTQISARIDWTASVDSPSNGYEVELRTSGTPGTGGSGFAQASTTMSTFLDVTGIQSGTTYFVYIRSICAGPTNGPWSAAQPFTTPAMAAPVAVAATDITASSFVARWEIVFGASEYEVLYSYDNFFSTNFTVSAGSSLNRLIPQLTSETLYKYKVRARAGSGPWSDYSNIISVTTTDEESIFARWTSEGWLQQPTSLKELIFEANFNTGINQFGATLSGKKMTIQPGVKVTIAPGTFITIERNVVNNSTAANFVIESNGNFNQQGNTLNVGNGATVKRNSFPIYRLDYTMWSSPVIGQNLLAFSPQTVPSRFYSYSSSLNVFTVIPNVASKTMVAGEGYLVRAPNNWIPYSEGAIAQSFPGVFTGVLKTGEVDVALNEGFNMVGNPYACDISADVMFGLNQNNDASAWFWRRRNNIASNGPTTSFYATYNEFGGTGVHLLGQLPGDADENTRPDGLIKVGQGFIVKSKAVSNGNIMFNKTMKVATEFNSDIFLKQNKDKSENSELTTVEKHKFYLELTGDEGIGSEILMGYASNATDGLDNMDSSYIGDSSIALTSLIDSDSYVIQAKALPFQSTSEFPLRFETSVAASYTIKLGDVTGMFVENVDPILVDMLTNTETNLRNGSYTFASEIGIYDTRFKVIFVETALGIVDVTADANAVVVINRNNVLTINAGTYTINNVDIYDMLGRKIYSKSNVEANEAVISDLRAQDQIILVQIATDHGVVTKKVQF